MRNTMQRIVMAGWLFAAVSLLAGDTTQTNLPATITISVSTNVVSGDNSSGCMTCGQSGVVFTPAVMNHIPCSPYKAATERWWITNVTQRVLLTTQWNGKSLTYSEDTILSSTTNLQKLHVEWKND